MNLPTAAALAALVLASAAPALAQRPNVLFVITDDQGWGDIGVHGNPVLETPVLDKLAAECARFDRFFVSPLCAPTRASLMTGRYHLRTGVHGVTRGHETMRADEYTLAEMFREGGYATGCFGKWHNGENFPHDPNGQGFDEFLGFCGGHLNNYFDATLQHNQGSVETSGYITDVLTDAAIAYMRAQVAAKKLFFCYVSINTPHSPFQVPDGYFDRFKDKELDDATACAYAMCANTDANIGRMLAALEEMGATQDTLVVFTCDNGPNTERFNAGMRGRKGSVHEGGVKVPLFMRWPRWIRPNTTVIPQVAHIDLLPTLSVMCTIDIGKTAGPLDGKSVAPLAYGMPVRWPDRGLYTFTGTTPDRGAVRTLQWRAVREGAGQPWQLYDMFPDPGQENDVAAGHPDVVTMLGEGFDKAFETAAAGGFEPVPTEIGHPEAPVVSLAAHGATLRPGPGTGIAYAGGQGWANDWVSGWTDAAGFPEWPVEVVAAGRYSVTLLYRCPPGDVGSRLAVTCGGASVEAVVAEPHGGDPLPSPDRSPRKEVYEMTWAELGFGEIDLPVGRAALAVKALEKKGERLPEIKAVRLRRVG
jgi:arylsulfatase A